MHKSTPDFVQPVSEIATSRIAIYLRIASVLKTKILRGVLKHGDRLPGIEALCDQYGIARATARQALQLLVSEGLIRSERGRGSFVIHERSSSQEESDGVFQLISPTPRNHSIRVLDRSRVATLPAEFEITEPTASKYIRIRKIHLQDKVPYGLYTLFVAAPIFKHFPPDADTSEKIFVLMHRHAKVRNLRGRERLAMHPADWQEADHLGYQVGMPVAHLIRILIDDTGQVVYAASNIYRGDRFQQDRTITGYFYGGNGEVTRETSEATRTRSPKPQHNSRVPLPI